MQPHAGQLFAACPRGLEDALAAELAGFGALGCRTVAGGVLFDGERAIAYRANLWSRLASRVLRQVGQRRYRDDDDLYRLALGVEWERFFDARHSLRVDLSAVRSPLRSLNYATLRVKDGIVDRLRERTGARPSIDTRSPDARVFAHLEDRQATLYLDLSGEPLFKRGWRSGREAKGEAPLKENLAAGLLALSGWTPQMPLYDPFCGSGTIVIEAAQRAFDIAPGLQRPFALEKLLDHDERLWASLRAEAIRRTQAAARRGTTSPRLAVSDIDPCAVEQARRNFERAGLPAQSIATRVVAAAQADPPCDAPGFIVANPPYGERIEAAGATATGSSRAGGHEQAMRAFGANLRAKFAGWQAWLLSSDRGLPAQLGMKERRRTPLYNGALECRLFGFEVFARAGQLSEDDAPRPPPPTPGKASRR